MEITQTPEEIQQALAAEQAKSKQLETERDQEREARGKAEQALLDANKIIDDLNVQVGQKPEAATAPTATLGTGKEAKTYRVVVPQFRFPGYGMDGVVKAADVKSNSELLAALVKAGAKVLELVPAAK